MIDVIQFSDEAFESPFVPLVENAYSEATGLLDKLPEVVDIKFTDNGASEDTGVGGFAVSGNQINLATLKNFRDHAAQRKNLRATVLHESFHIQQGFTFDKSPFTALDSAVYEGCAVVFERKYADNAAKYADYSQNTNEELGRWLDEIRNVGAEYFEDTDTWHRWAFYHPDYNQKWIIYKVGTWLVDRLIKEDKIDVLDLKDKSAGEIMELTHF